ncbi:MAG: flagellar basal body P-ring protein FlgI, partial [Silanimonas sp.]
DFTTASRMVDALTKAFGEAAATALDAGTVQVQTPTDAGARVAFLARVENLTLDPGQIAAKVVVNARTGTVVIGSNVQVMPAAVAHGSLTVTITESANVSQPAPFSQGETVVTPESTVEATVDGSRMFLFRGGTSLDQIVRAVNEVGAAPGDVIAILEALKQAGALRAELEII